jgi:hypothetical protein
MVARGATRGGPYPILAIAGEQGSAKTVLSKLLRALIDPSMAPVRALPRDERELFIAASNGHVLAFDNFSGLPPWLSDTLCRLTSGGTFSTRRLFTDQDEILFAAARPVILNGIEGLITRPDLADRAILLTLVQIADQHRRLENALWREFELARPHILGALLVPPRMAYACCRRCASSGCRAWPTSRCGPRPVRAPSGPLAASKLHIRTIVVRRSTTSSTPIGWRPMCAKSWPSERIGPEAHPIFCRPAPVPPAIPWVGPVWLAQEPSRTRWAAAAGADIFPHTRD